MSTTAKILIVDDHQIVRDGLRLLLAAHKEWEVSGVFDAAAAWRVLETDRPNLLLVDLDLPGENGVSLTSRVRRAYPEVRVLVLTGAGEPHQLRAALAAGAHGLLRKGDASEQLVSAIRTVLAGETYLSPQAREQIVANLGHALRSALTPRETEVLARVADGQSTKEIAFELGCSVKTIETHRANLMSKLGINNVASLTKYALRQGLTSL